MSGTTLNILIALLSGGVVVAIITLIGNILMWKLHRKAEKEDKKDDLTDRVSEVAAELEDMKAVQEARHKEIIELLKVQKDGSVVAIRNAILTIYYTYLPWRALPVYERENLGLLCDKYFELGGNAFVRDIKPEMDEWKTISDISYFCAENLYKD